MSKKASQDKNDSMEDIIQEQLMT